MGLSEHWKWVSLFPQNPPWNGLCVIGTESTWKYSEDPSCLSENMFPYIRIGKGAWPTGLSKWWMTWASSVEGGNGSVTRQLCSLMCHTGWYAQWGMPEWCLWECQIYREALRKLRDEEERGQKGEKTKRKKMREREVENKERWEEAWYKKGAGELESTPYVILTLDSCFFPKKSIFSPLTKQVDINEPKTS